MSFRILMIFCVLFVLKFSIVDAQDTLKASNYVDPKLIAVLWQQHSSEYRALCYQAFNVAAERLDDAKLKRRKRYAIITDIDETALDNSYYEATRIRRGEEFTPSAWKEWTDKANATPLPGAVEFFKMAKKRKVSIFYISNRDTSEVGSTLLNLQRYGFPDADTAHLLFLENTSSKEIRRQKILKHYEVIMLLGDNLNDFESIFERKSNELRDVETDKVRNDWGRRFIVLPNATYGEWENALYEYKRGLSPEQKVEVLINKLQEAPSGSK